MDDRVRLNRMIERNQDRQNSGFMLGTTYGALLVIRSQMKDGIIKRVSRIPLIAGVCMSLWVIVDSTSF